MPTRTAPLIVTTSHTASEAAVEKARALAAELSSPYVPRGNNSLQRLLADYSVDRVLTVEGDELALNHSDGTTYRYHPNLGFVRALNLLRGQRDVFVEAVDIRPGEKVLDCTLGFGSEALLAALLVGGEGRVVGLESSQELALVTREGLRNRTLQQPKLEAALRRIEVVNADYVDFIRNLEPGAFDLICFDPFFHERIEGSETNINPLLRFGNPALLDPESVTAATRKAARRVLVKHPVDTELPAPLPSLRAAKIAARKRPVAYSIFDGLTPAPTV